MKTKLRYSNASYWLIAIIVLLFLYLMFFGMDNILNDKDCASCAIFEAIGFSIIMLWSCIFINYFIWASYFYNINFGITNKDWKKIYSAKENRASGKLYNQDDIEEEPLYNPYNNETFGLPPGTVRGMIAFTLLFGAIALLIVSFGIKNDISSNNYFMEQFEFFKTAFLMMIAFYFGSRSLKYLKGDTPISPKNTKAENIDVASNGTVANAPSVDNTKEIVVINADDQNSDNKDGKDNPPITAIDPMTPTKK